ncbi:MAG: hypothetical protein K8S23_17045 [Candidatus Cloacimonetes bacterium]|nr:hypothetical protein [Candidatus Cloacimonadota bacterium]
MIRGDFIQALKKKKVLILGGIGNGTVIAYAINDAYEPGQSDLFVAGFLNDREVVGSKIEGFSVLGKTNEIQRFLSEDYLIINTIYRIDGNEKRIENLKKLKIPDEKFVSFIHPSAYVTKNVKIGNGVIIMPNVSISSGVEIGNNSLIMVNATIGHNSKIGKYCHIAAQSSIGSFVNIQNGIHIGLNATIRENCVLGKFSSLGMGSVLLNNIGEKEIWVGNPAKLLRTKKTET